MTFAKDISSQKNHYLVCFVTHYLLDYIVAIHILSFAVFRA